MTVSDSVTDKKMAYLYLNCDGTKVNMTAVNENKDSCPTFKSVQAGEMTTFSERKDIIGIFINKSLNTEVSKQMSV